MSFSDLAELVKNRWPAYIWYTFGQILMVGVVMVSAFFLFTFSFATVAAYFMDPAAGAGIPVGAFVLGGVMGLALLAVVVIIQNYFTFGLYRLADSKSNDMSLHAFHEHAKKDYWKTLWSLVVFGIMVFLVIALAGLALFILGQFVPMPVVGVAGAVLALVGLYYIIPVAFVTLQIVLKGEGAMKAFESCRELIHGRWWRTLGTAIVVGIVMSIPLGVISYVAEKVDPSQPQSLTDFDPSHFESFVSVPEMGLISLVFLVLIILVNILPTYAYLAIYRALNKVK